MVEFIKMAQKKHEQSCTALNSDNKVENNVMDHDNGKKRSQHNNNNNNNNNDGTLTRHCDTMELFTYSPLNENLAFNFITSTESGNYSNKSGKTISPTNQYQNEFKPFSDRFKKYLTAKWSKHKADANEIMLQTSNEMLNQVWYWGEISRLQAQKQLTDKPTGTFLIRDSETAGCQFTLSFRILNITFHYRLEYWDSYWHFEDFKYKSIVEMINDILYRCSSDIFVCFVKASNEMQPPFPVILKYPLSRYINMPKLQDLCCYVIQCHVNIDDIAHLPIPPALQDYLTDNAQQQLIFSSL